MSEVRVPRAVDLMYPTLAAIDQLGGSATNRQLEERVPRIAGVTERQMSVILQQGNHQGRERVFYNMDWARTILKKAGAIDNRIRSVWSITPEGYGYLRMDPADADRELRKKDKEIRDAVRGASKKKKGGSRRRSGDWRSNLLTILKEMEPVIFERLMSKLLRDLGFDDLERTRRTKDGEVEGVGKMSVPNLSLYIQCKRYTAAVGPGAIRRFRTAMAGHGDRGLFITTGFFSDEARTEAARMTPDVDLVDGEQLCDLLKKHRLGVAAEERVVEEVTLDKDFFTGL